MIICHDTHGCSSVQHTLPYLTKRLEVWELWGIMGNYGGNVGVYGELRGERWGIMGNHGGKMWNDCGIMGNDGE